MNPTDAVTRRPTMRTWAVIVGLALLGVVLALTQPWLLFVDEVVQEQLPVAAAPAAPTAPAALDTPLAEVVEAESSQAEPAPSPDPVPAPTPSGPVTLLEGSFISRDHATRGAVSVVQLEDGSRVLAIEGLETDNGPDLFVYLDDDAADAESSAFDDGFSLGALRGNIGDLVYEIPDSLALADIASVAIWCDRFSALFGAADLLPVGS